MADVNTLQTRLELLEKALASGTLVVRHGDTSITYNTTSELLHAIDYIKGQIGKADGSTARKPGYIEQTGKGYH